MRSLKAGIVASVIAGLAAAQIVAAQQAPEDTPPSSPSTTGPNAQAEAHPAAPPAPPAGTKSAPMTMRPKAAAPSTDAVFKDIEATLGFVPQFFRHVADSQLASFWSSMKDFEMNPNTALDSKTKELIGLAVAAQIPCDYCVAAHTASLRGLGASDQEIREAIGMAAITRLGSTVLNGSEIDKVQFKKDLQRMSKDAGPVKREAKR